MSSSWKANKPNRVSGIFFNEFLISSPLTFDYCWSVKREVNNQQVLTGEAGSLVPCVCGVVVTFLRCTGAFILGYTEQHCCLYQGVLSLGQTSICLSVLLIGTVLFLSEGNYCWVKSKQLSRSYLKPLQHLSSFTEFVSHCRASSTPQPSRRFFTAAQHSSAWWMQLGTALNTL